MYQKSETSQALFEALGKAQAEFKPLHKSRTATVRMKSGGEYSYKYADLSDLLAMVTLALLKHGLVAIQPFSITENQIVIETSLYHSSGEWINTVLSLPNVATGNMNAIQQIGSVSKYGRRYALEALLNISSEEDTDGQGGEELGKSAGQKNKGDKEKYGQGGNTTGGQPDGGEYQKLRLEFTNILKAFTEKEQKQAEAMAGKISPTDTKSLQNLIKVWKLKKPPAETNAQEVVQKVFGDGVDNPDDGGVDNQVDNPVDKGPDD